MDIDRRRGNAFEPGPVTACHALGRRPSGFSAECPRRTAAAQPLGRGGHGYRNSRVVDRSRRGSGGVPRLDRSLGTAEKESSSRAGSSRISRRNSSRAENIWQIRLCPCGKQRRNCATGIPFSIRNVTVAADAELTTQRALWVPRQARRVVSSVSRRWETWPHKPQPNPRSRDAVVTNQMDLRGTRSHHPSVVTKNGENLGIDCGVRAFYQIISTLGSFHRQPSGHGSARISARGENKSARMKTNRCHPALRIRGGRSFAMTPIAIEG